MNRTSKGVLLCADEYDDNDKKSLSLSSSACSNCFI